MKNYTGSRFAPSRGGRSTGAKVMGMLPKLPGIALPLVITGVIGAAGYWVYKKFAVNTPDQKAQDTADKAGLTNLTTRQVASVNSLDALKKSLSARGLNVSNVHQSFANTLNAAMNTSAIDHGEIIKIVKSMGLETFQLTAIAYGQRELRGYVTSPLHIFEPDFWIDSFSTLKLYGTLKYHLQVALTSSEFLSIGAYVNTVP